MHTFKEAVEFLITNGYIKQVKSKFVVTAKFNAAMGKGEQGLVTTPTGQLAVRTPLLGAVSDWSNRYLMFIVDAQVPPRGEDAHGGVYDMNKFSDKGMKAFRNALEKEGVNYDLLVKSTLLYYKGGVRLKKAIGNYMSEGFWRTDYETLINSLQKGNLETHIKSQLDEGSNSRYGLG